MLEQVVVGGDLSRLSPQDRLIYYRAVCESVGLNPLTRPFEYITLNGRMVLYARKDATEQLRDLKGVSITRLERELVDGIYTVTAYAQDGKGRTDTAIGAVPVSNLQGEVKANAMMKAETKAKRRVTLSICGLGMLDESETESIPGAVIHKDQAEQDLLAMADAGEQKIEAKPAEPDPNAIRHALYKKCDMAAKKLKLDAKTRAEAWATYCEGATPKDVDVAALNDLLNFFRSRMGEEAWAEFEKAWEAQVAFL